MLTLGQHKSRSRNLNQKLQIIFYIKISLFCSYGNVVGVSFIVLNMLNVLMAQCWLITEQKV